MKETPIAVRSQNNIPMTLSDMKEYADLISKSGLAPKDYQNKPENTLVAIQMGLEVGLHPMQAIQNIAVINGRPSLWGDAMLALVQSHPDCDSIDEDFDDAAMTAICVVRRRGHGPHKVTFSKADAETAGLWKKQGPWTQYPKRMLQVRARSFACRDKFSDALKGLNSAEESRDIIEINPAEAPGKPPLTVEGYDENQNPSPEPQNEPSGADKAPIFPVIPENMPLAQKYADVLYKGNAEAGIELDTVHAEEGAAITDQITDEKEKMVCKAIFSYYRAVEKQALSR